MINRERYWRCEYENLRRKKNKELDDLKKKQAVFMDKTWKLLKAVGLSDKVIFEWYRHEH